MNTRAVFFPFDLFGGGGTADGARLLADAVREMIDDNEREEVPTRARAYAGRLAVEELPLDTLGDYTAWRAAAQAAARSAWDDGDFLLWVGGNHLAVLPVYDELSAARPETTVFQFDAHLDVYNLSDCTEELSHGNFLLHCAGPLPPLVNVGHRELLLHPDHVARHYRRTFPADRVHADADAVAAELRRLASQAGRVFIDLDCDVFDLAYFPALPDHHPFGLSTGTFLRLLDAVWSDKVAGLAVSEFCPAHDHRDRSLATLLWLIEHLLLRLYE